MHSSVITETCFLIRSQRTRSDIYVYSLLEETPFSAWPLALLKNPTFMWICVTNKSISTSYLHHNSRFMASLIAQLVKNLSAMQETRFNSWVRKIPWRRNRLPTPVFLNFTYFSACKESTCNAGDLGSIRGLGRFPWRRERLPTPVFWSGEFQRPNSPWGCKEADTTEWLSLHLPFIRLFINII